MQTNFTPEQLRDPATARSNRILRTCVHCGFCTATCPTYQVLGDELDCPRGRIYLIKDMLEAGRPADAKTVKHIDRCLSCLACMTTCPSGVHYMHLVDHARAYIERDLSPAAARAGAALAAGARSCPIRGASGWRSGPRALGRPFARADAGAAAGDAGARAARAAAAKPGSTRRRCFRPRARGAGAWRCSPAARSGCSTRGSTPRPSAS